MRLDPTKSDYDQGDYWWVGHSEGVSGWRRSDDPPNAVMIELVKRRYDIDILGGVEDKEASYSYDDWALCKLDDKFYLLSKRKYC